MLAILFLVLLLLLIAIFFVYSRPTSQSTKCDTFYPVGTLPLTSVPLNIQNRLTQGVPIVPLRNFAVPETFDARQQWPGLITPPLNQEQCGSCWAYSTTTSMSDRYRIKNPQDQELTRSFTYSSNPNESYTLLNNISPRQMISCDLCGSSIHPDGEDTLCNYGCSGGVLADAFDYLTHRGANTILANTFDPIVTERTDYNCDFNPQASVYRGVRKYIVTTPNESIQDRQLKIKQEIFLHGPVSAAYTVYNSFYTFFQNNPTGIYTQSDVPPNDFFQGGHAVVIIGWGKQNDQEYWIVRNSWGQSWGDNGFFKIAYDWSPPSTLPNNPNEPKIGIMDEVWTVAV